MILTIGGDMRYAHLVRIAAQEGMDIKCIGLEMCSFDLPHTDLSTLSEADAVILPNPWRSGMVLPFSHQIITLNDVFCKPHSDALFLLSDTTHMPPETYSRRIIDLSVDTEYVMKNAHLTAEGAVSIAMKRGEYALMDSTCLVIGYGRIARRLALILHALGAKVYAAARREEVRRQIKSDNLEACAIHELSEVLPHAHYIFTTPPVQIFDRALLECIRPDALLMDLASSPFGFDLAQAHALALHASRENALPGRYCPASAGNALLDAVKRVLTDHHIS